MGFSCPNMDGNLSFSAAGYILSPNPTSKILSFFNEEIKDVILKIKASDTLDWYEYQNILDKYKDSYEVKVAILRNENTPTPIYDLILDEELKKSAPNKFVL